METREHEARKLPPWWECEDFLAWFVGLLLNCSYLTESLTLSPLHSFKIQLMPKGKYIWAFDRHIALFMKPNPYCEGIKPVFTVGNCLTKAKALRFCLQSCVLFYVITCWSQQQKAFIIRAVNAMEHIKPNNAGSTFSKEKATIINCLNRSIWFRQKHFAIH